MAPGPAGSVINQRMVVVILPRRSVGVYDCLSDKKLTNSKVAPQLKQSSIHAKRKMLGKCPSSKRRLNHPIEVMTMPRISAGPKPMRLEIGGPAIPPKIEPKPMATKLKATNASSKPRSLTAKMI